jgi:NAD(P)H-dependent FMN reductase
MRILAVSGSLGRGSANSAILHEAVHHVAPPDELVVHETVDALPHFSPDRDTDSCPPAVDRWRRAVAGADAVLIATPEYAGGMPGALKNALDWLVVSGELYGKPAVIVSAAPSADRGGRARESVAVTLAMQGGDVRDSFSVAVRRDAPAEELATHAAVVAARAARALAS